MDVMDGGLGIALQRRLGLLVNPAPGMSPELAATLDLGPMPELLVHQGWKRFCYGGAVGAVALQNSVIQLINPAGSGLLVILEGAMFETLAAQLWRFNTQVLDQGVPANTTGTKLDTRQDNVLGAALVKAGTIAIGFNPASCQFTTSALTTFLFPILPVILGPGAIATWSVNTVNIGIDAFTLWWRERKQVTPAELVP